MLTKTLSMVSASVTPEKTVANIRFRNASRRSSSFLTSRSGLRVTIWPSHQALASLTEASASSLFHIEVKMTLVGLIGTRPQHRAKDAAGVVAHRFQERSFGFI
jgi:hypothetical protein